MRGGDKWAHLFDMIEHLDPGESEVEVEHGWIAELLFFKDPHGPDSPEVVIQLKAAVNLGPKLRHLAFNKGTFVYFVLLIKVATVVLIEVQAHQLVLLLFIDKVLEVPFDARADGVRIIQHCLVEIVGNVHCSGVPSRVFKVDKDYMREILQVSEDIILLGIIVCKYHL